ncbi:hypothetical protein PCH_Pc03g00080 [Penicillium rubens Wisconsin 54-1255]|uniref:Uncharacterized protein n=1 Tax=Penicillium rubens (strain ATCC 28089 / DSM 1075 / NRRL 1951 / Wisconsin 54-1255) TaxID=500485 RepID=B6GVQ7_PENRW|nr:hypothetical protein PCH_Pc03g00080 [Penicillium rubens Wisconsin 54-1255]
MEAVPTLWIVPPGIYEISPANPLLTNFHRNQRDGYCILISGLGKALDAIGEKERPPNGGPGIQPTRRLSFEGVRHRRTGRHIGTWSDAQNHWGKRAELDDLNPP